MKVISGLSDDLLRGRVTDRVLISRRLHNDGPRSRLRGLFAGCLLRSILFLLR